jgi:hypothetical protein
VQKDWFLVVGSGLAAHAPKLPHSHSPVLENAYTGKLVPLQPVAALSNFPHATVTATGRKSMYLVLFLEAVFAIDLAFAARHKNRRGR